ncbi:MAG: hypothetical protein QXQ66_09720, partial [Candidatus Hadarchaeum sp.]|uniref:hypothetical protein n=1 Tax=Candidatus Hadarchaeum sp. TaxID=2883567 RepID=UPI00317132D7
LYLVLYSLNERLEGRRLRGFAEVLMESYHMPPRYTKRGTMCNRFGTMTNFSEQCCLYISIIGQVDACNTKYKTFF